MRKLRILSTAFSQVAKILICAIIKIFEDIIGKLLYTKRNNSFSNKVHTELNSNKQKFQGFKNKISRVSQANFMGFITNFQGFINKLLEFHKQTFDVF